MLKISKRMSPKPMISLRMLSWKVVWNCIQGGKFISQLWEFSKDSSRGIKTHIKRKHTNEVETFPFECELCGCKLENKIELKYHMVTHLFQSVNFQCGECDYWSVKEMTIAVHVGKNIVKMCCVGCLSLWLVTRKT